MCGIVGMVGQRPVNQEIYDSLLLLQHRGQDSTGIATAEASGVFHISKEKGQVREAFRTRDMRSLLGNMGVGHVRYATKGDAANEQESQPFYGNAPYGIILVHNGNLTNTRELASDLFNIDRRHMNSSSDTEMLVNVLATELEGQIRTLQLEPDQVFDAIETLHERVEGSYACIALIGAEGLLAFRDPYGIRPLILGRKTEGLVGTEWIVASESLVIEFTPPETRYWNVTIETIWHECIDVRRRQSSITNAAAVREPDGSVKVAIGDARDGAPNWLDTGGHHRGFMILRWLDNPEAPPVTTTVITR